MCLISPNSKCLIYKNHIIAFKRFFYTNSYELFPFFQRDNCYKFINELGRFAIESELKEQDIRFSLEATDIVTNNFNYIEIYSSILSLGLHSLLTPVQFSSRRIKGYKYNDIVLIVLIHTMDVQIVSGDEIVSKKIYLPTLEEFKDILKHITDYDYINKLKTLNSKSSVKLLRGYFTKKYLQTLTKIYDKLKEITNENNLKTRTKIEVENYDK